MKNEISTFKGFSIANKKKSFAAMFLEEPHKAANEFAYKSNYFDERVMRFFDNDNSILPFTTSTLAFEKIEYFFNTKQLDKAYEKSKFELLMLFRILEEKEEMPPFNEVRIADYCNHLIAVLKDEAKALATFVMATKLIEETESILS